MLRSKLNQNGGVTLFIPSNAAWKNENVEKVVNNVTLLENILNLHLVSEKITVSGIADRGAKEVRGGIGNAVTNLSTLPLLRIT